MAKGRESTMEKIAISIPRELLRLVDGYAQKHLEDRSTAIRQLVAEALRTHELKEAAEDYRRGRATLWEIASRLGISYREADEALRSVGMPLVHIEATDLDLAQIEQQADKIKRGGK